VTSLSQCYEFNFNFLQALLTEFVYISFFCFVFLYLDYYMFIKSLNTVCADT